MTEREYRDDPRDSYSTIKDFIKDRKKYYKKYILRERVKEEEDTTSILLGQLVDKLLQPGFNIEDEFVLAMNNKPTGQMLLFVEALFRRTLEATGMNDEITRPISALMEDAFNDVKFDKDGNEVAFKKKELSYAIERFTGTNAEEYYNQLRTSTAKYVINPSDLENATNIKMGLEQSFNTRRFVMQQSKKGIDVYYQLPIFFKIEDYDFKGLIDKVIVDHENKIVEPGDFKTTWRVENFDRQYKEYKYHLQVASYNTAIKFWMEQEGISHYTQLPLKFIVSDSINYMHPLVYETKASHHNSGMNGYIDLYGDYNPGLLKALSDIEWHKENNIWNISKDNYNSKGVVTLKDLV